MIVLFDNYLSYPISVEELIVVGHKTSNGVNNGVMTILTFPLLRSRRRALTP
jgi:hypothetical protein